MSKETIIKKVFILTILMILALIIPKFGVNNYIAFFDVLAFSFMLIFWLYYLSKLLFGPKRKKSYIEDSATLHDYDDTIKKYFPEINGENFLLDILFTRFVQVEDALNRCDFEVIKELCTDSLYDVFYSRWKSYSAKKEKCIREDINVHSYNIQRISLENDMISIKMYLHVSYYDYVIDADGKIIKGNKQTRKHQQFILEFVIDKDKSIKCPNCGAHISSKTCEYCNTTMKDVYYDFCLAKIGLANNRQVIDIDLKK